MHPIPRSPGVYAVELLLLKTRRISIGQLGSFQFQEGVYVYFGSAYGAGGLRARLHRHIRLDSKKRHWHIDYLSQFTRVYAVCYAHSLSEDPKHTHMECRWCWSLLELPGAVIPAPKFGASDCTSGCPAHLLHFPFNGINTPKYRSFLTQAQVRFALAKAARVRLDAVHSLIV